VILADKLQCGSRKNGVGVGTRPMIEIYSTLTLGYIQNVGILRSEISNVIIKH
jgi:hypothetical protein